MLCIFGGDRPTTNFGEKDRTVKNLGRDDTGNIRKDTDVVTSPLSLKIKKAPLTSFAKGQSNGIEDNLF